ncbi:MAG: InlB B-repeat-containing protein, partial [Bacteroidales bacterium]|nr:InlB B-repeat-containing protein [Bacteroidales bacterium]
SDPVWRGHKFTGWNKEIPITIPAEDVTITAQWEDETMQYVKFVTKWDDNTLTTYESFGAYPGESIEVTAPNDPERTGYSFQGWITEDGQTATIPTVMPDNGMIIYADWKINQYTITFDTDGGTAIADIKQDYNTAITAPTAPSKTGYTFDYWTVDGVQTAIPATMPAKNITFKAKWKINTYKIVFHLDNGDPDVVVEAEYGASVTAPANFSKGNHTFDCWSRTVPATMPASEEPLEITALWIEDGKYVVKLLTENDLNEEVVVWSSQSYYEDEAIDYTSYADPTRDGYTFQGWATTADGQATTMPAKMPEGGATLYAKWGIKQYTITYNTNGGSAINETNTLKRDYNSAIPKPSDPSKTGNTFKGWFADSDCTTPCDFTNGKVTGDITLYAKWEVNTYTITFNSNGGSHVDPITQDYNSAIDAPANPSREGFEFMRWNPELPATMPAGGLDVTAVWQEAEPPVVNIVTINGIQVYPRDPEKPEVVVECIGSGEVKIEATDNSNVQPKVEYTVNGGESKLYEGPFTLDTHGEVAIKIVATDNVGNEADPIVVKAVVRREAALAAGSYTYTQLSGKDVVLEGFDLDGADIYSIVIDEKDEYKDLFVAETNSLDDQILNNVAVGKHTLHFYTSLNGNKHDTGIKDVELTVFGYPVMAEQLNINANGYCEDENADITLEFKNIDRPVWYKIKDVHDSYQEFKGVDKLAKDVGIMNFLVNGLPDGNLTLKATFTDDPDKNTESDTVTFNIKVNLPSGTIVQLFDDLIAIDNHDDLYTAFQWYKDGVLIEGADQQYYQVEGKLYGKYSAFVTISNGDKLKVCSADFGKKISKSLKRSVNAYPNPARANEEITLELLNFDDVEYEGCVIKIVNAQGAAVATIDNCSRINTVSLPSGTYTGYVIRSGSNGDRVSFKLIVK